MTTIFRITSYLEGISYLLLLGVGVPLKYLATPANDSWVKALGMPHGILFMLYVVLAIVMRSERDWNMRTTIHALVAAIIPFGTFLFDRKEFGK